MVLRSISYFLIFRKPVMFYLGILTFTSLLITATMGYLFIKGKIKFKHHKLFAGITITLALIHGALGVLAYI